MITAWFMCCIDKKPSKPNTLRTSQPRKTSKVAKLVLCGNSYVGKTSITTRYKADVFKEVHDPTIAATYL